MIRRLVWIVVAASQLAALPLSVDPPTAEVGIPLTVSISLPDATTELIGFPDLGSFALLAPPERSGNNITLHLLPLRPGIQSIPALPFRTGQHRVTTDAVTLSVAAPPVPDRPHPLRPLPEPAREQQKRSNNLLFSITAGFAALGLVLTLFLRRRRAQIAQPAPDLDEQFAQLAAAVSLIQDIDNPEWHRFCRQLERSRFAPLSRNQNQLQELTGEFVRLREETS